MSVKDKLDYLNDTKQAIKTAIQSKGQAVSDADTFRSYADKINAIETSPSLIAKTITENGTYNASDDNADGYSSVVVDINLKVYEVSSTLENLTMSGKSFAINNTDYITIFTPAQYYEVPETVEITIGGVLATQGTDYTYLNGVITIYGDIITGDIEITASAIATGYSNIKLSIGGNTGSLYYTLNDDEEVLLCKIKDNEVVQGVESIVLNSVTNLSIRLISADIPWLVVENADGETLLSVNTTQVDITPYLQDGLKITGSVYY